MVSKKIKKKGLPPGVEDKVLKILTKEEKKKIKKYWADKAKEELELNQKGGK